MLSSRLNAGARLGPPRGTSRPAGPPPVDHPRAGCAPAHHYPLAQNRAPRRLGNIVTAPALVRGLRLGEALQVVPHRGDGRGHHRIRQETGACAAGTAAALPHVGDACPAAAPLRCRARARLRVADTGGDVALPRRPGGGGAVPATAAVRVAAAPHRPDGGPTRSGGAVVRRAGAAREARP